MTTLPEQIFQLANEEPGLTDREITNRLRGASEPQQPINIAARSLANKGLITRQRRSDGLLGNYPTGKALPISTYHAEKSILDSYNQLSEDEVKESLRIWLEKAGWAAEIAWGRSRGIDVEAKRGAERWVIEAKGIGSLQPMRVNYFIGMLGETLQRMDDTKAKYSIAMPDVPQFRGLWKRLPVLAKKRTEITALFVSADGSVKHETE
tara:strand:+ start:566 stop:1189 length:624 start_codon:yes stop_codon:yes gene_type:complete